MTDIKELITENIATWTSAVSIKSRSGRGSSNKLNLSGINKLRELILGLGLAGKLTPKNFQLSNDIKEEISDARKNYSIYNNRKLKDYKLGQPLLHEFTIPRGWEWKRVSELCDLQTGATPSRQHPEYFGGDNRWLVSGDINKFVIEDCEGRITDEGLQKSNCKILPEKTVMIALNGQGKTRATVALLKVKAACNQSLVGMIPFSNDILDSTFLLYALKYRYFEIRDITGQNQRRGLNMGLVAELSLPLPPISEQNQIVTKIEELMSLCDQLEQQSEASIDAHQLLVEELLSTLTNSENAQEFEQNWARIAEHFDLLFTTEHSIEQLKQTILQLAVMGKLVPQDPTDEPASKLLERIAQEKEQLIKEKAIKKEKTLPALTEEEKPFELPKGWALARVGNLVSKLGSGSTPRGGKAAYVESGVPFLRSQNVWNDGVKTDDIAYIPEDTHNSMSNTKVYPNDVLLNITGASLGRATIFPSELKEANVSQHVTIIRLIEKEMSEFVLLGIHSPMIQKLVWARQVGVAIEGLSKKVLELFEFPIPPLPEQKRIISKVHSLMTLCEQLKANIIAANSTQIYLAETIVEKALGRNPVIKLEEKEENKAMKISTELSLGSITYDKTAILSPLIGESGADAKSVWRKSGLKLPDFYRQLKSEITSGFVAKPAKAQFEG